MSQASGLARLGFGKTSYSERGEPMVPDMAPAVPSRDHVWPVT
jgi:hypothetical protein